MDDGVKSKAVTSEQYQDVCFLFVFQVGQGRVHASGNSVIHRPFWTVRQTDVGREWK